MARKGIGGAQRWRAKVASKGGEHRWRAKVAVERASVELVSAALVAMLMVAADADLQPFLILLSVSVCSKSLLKKP